MDGVIQWRRMPAEKGECGNRATYRLQKKNNGPDGDDGDLWYSESFNEKVSAAPAKERKGEKKGEKKEEKEKRRGGKIGGRRGEGGGGLFPHCSMTDFFSFLNLYHCYYFWFFLPDSFCFMICCFGILFRCASLWDGAHGGCACGRWWWWRRRRPTP